VRLAVGTVDVDVHEHVEISQGDFSRLPKLGERGFGHRDQSASKAIDSPTSVFQRDSVSLPLFWTLRPFVRYVCIAW